MILPAMPTVAPGRPDGVDRYLIGVRQFRQQILPPGLPATTVWGYGSVRHPRTFHCPSFTIEARVDRPVRVTWVNQLVDRAGRYLPHLLAVDPTLHWANPPGGVAGRDSVPDFGCTPGRYRGPVPIVTHLHGGHTAEESDGYPEAWFLPDARDLPRGYATEGSFYPEFREKFEQRYGIRWRPGTATFRYGNDQRATTLWFHDHALGMTRVNVYAGPAGFYLLRGGEADLPPGVLPGPAPALGDRPGTAYHEIPIAVQDRSFTADGALSYPASRADFDGYPGPYSPVTDVPPIWNPEVFGTTIVVNGRTWPVLEVERRRYRLRLLNGCGSRFLILRIACRPTSGPDDVALPLWQIGSEGGFLPRPVLREHAVMAPAQRVDAIVDFGDAPEGTVLYLRNDGPDEPYQGGEPGTQFEPANRATTGQVTKFVVRARVGEDTSVPPEDLVLPPCPPLGPAVKVRPLALLEQESELPDGPVAALLGTIGPDGTPTAERWSAPVTETPKLGSTEIWEFHNATEDAHPIHVHQVQFQVVGRGPDGTAPPFDGEAGHQDTVVALPGDVTRIRARFDLPGRYVWHCHIVEHEDNEMMRPFQVVR
ncbi:multicopper oxidase domain-containing protein [Actinopolymorpha rutila]